MNEELAKLTHLARLFILADEAHEAAMDEARETRCWKKSRRALEAQAEREEGSS